LEKYFSIDNFWSFASAVLKKIPPKGGTPKEMKRGQKGCIHQRGYKMNDKVKIGIIGCGNISQAYFGAAKKFKILEVVSCADINMEAAKAKAEENEVKAVSVEEMLADPEIQIVINLTIPAVHAEVSMKILEAGKHVHCEKPLAVTREDGKKVLDLAKAKGLRVGCAPDTFMGAGLQTCRKIIDDNWLGKVVSGTAFMMAHGPEAWHPNPAFFYEVGGGPMFDMGPYYITALLHLLGPVKRVSAITSKAYEERIAGSEALLGTKLPVEIPTHYSGTLEFVSGPVISMTISFDVWKHSNSTIEIHGTEGSMSVPDPNSFSGDVKVFKPGAEDWATVPHSHKYAENMRSIGVADMAYAILSGRKHRCNGEMAYHALDIMHSFEDSSNSGRAVELESTCDQPAPLPADLLEGLLDT
jgi:predicted dehydrogenase